uniref:F-box only protein 27-like isoform X1 n=1 Tax=Pogona vitticeps TaxID=103695 RepID=A0ABM5ERS3_9SAUR
MGLVKSRRPLAETPPEEVVQSPVGLNQLPDEVLELILSWVPARTLVARCRLVCRRWRNLIGRPTLWKLQWQRDPALQAVLHAAQRCPRMDWCRVGVLRPFGRNLIKNPCGRERFLHWETEHNGDGWAVEANRKFVEGAEAQTCFVSSYRWCAKSQLVDLLREGLWGDLLDTHQPEIVVSDWWGAREDCSCVYMIQVTLVAADQKSVMARFNSQPDPIPQWNDAEYQQVLLASLASEACYALARCYDDSGCGPLRGLQQEEVVSHVFRDYGPGVRYVRFWHRGQDTQYWAGHYGARITNSTVVVRFSQDSQ